MTWSWTTLCQTCPVCRTVCMQLGGPSTGSCIFISFCSTGVLFSMHASRVQVDECHRAINIIRHFQNHSQDKMGEYFLTCFFISKSTSPESFLCVHSFVVNSLAYSLILILFILLEYLLPIPFHLFTSLSYKHVTRVCAIIKVSAQAFHCMDAPSRL